MTRPAEAIPPVVRSVLVSWDPDTGWGSVLDTFDGRRSITVAVFGGLVTAINLALRLTGRLGTSIDQAGGQLPAHGA